MLSYQIKYYFYLKIYFFIFDKTSNNLAYVIKVNLGKIIF